MNEINEEEGEGEEAEEGLRMRIWGWIPLSPPNYHLKSHECWHKQALLGVVVDWGGHLEFRWGDVIFPIESLTGGLFSKLARLENS